MDGIIPFRMKLLHGRTVDRFMAQNAASAPEGRYNAERKKHEKEKAIT